MKKIAVANRKGGVGKTTVSVHLASGLARMGRKVLLIDADPQGSCAALLDCDAEYRLDHVLQGQLGEPAVLPYGLRFIGASAELAVIAQGVLSRPYNAQLILRERLEPIIGGYEYLVIDTAPSYSPLGVNVLFAVDQVIAPVNMESSAAHGLEALIDELEQMADAGAARLRWIIPTMVDNRKGLTDDMLQALGRFRNLLGPAIRYQARFSELAALRQLIYEVDPSGRGATDMAALVKEVARAA